MPMVSKRLIFRVHAHTHTNMHTHMHTDCFTKLGLHPFMMHAEVKQGTLMDELCACIGTSDYCIGVFV